MLFPHASLLGLALAGLATAPAVTHARDSFPAGNWLADGGFELRAEPRELGLPSGSDRRDFGEMAGWRFDSDQAREGKRSLVLSGPRPFTWRIARDFPGECDAVFSVYVRSDKPGVEVEAGFEVFALDDHYKVGPRATGRRTLALTPGWQRLVVPLHVSKETDQGHIRVHLLKTWVRPLTPDKGDVWIDAAQLEVDRAGPGAFTSMMPAFTTVREERQVLRDWLGPSPEKDPVPPPPVILPSGSVPFTISETDGLVRHNEVASGGIPFAPGQVFDSSTFQVTDSSGTVIPVQTAILAQRPSDGSAISMLVEFPASLAAYERRNYRFHYGPAFRSHVAPSLATEETGAITLNLNGRVWRISRENFPGLELTTLDGRRFFSDALPPEIVEIERNGPFHAIIRMRGRLLEAGGKRVLGVAWDGRFHAFAGSDMLEVEMSHEQQEHVSHLAVRSIGLTLPVSPVAPAGRTGADPVRVALATGGELALPAPDGGLVLTQLHQYFGEGRYDLVIDTGVTSQRRENVRATGAVRFPDVAVAVTDFDNMNPAAIAWSPGRVTVYAQPPRHTTCVELPFGISQTFRFVLAPPSGWSAVQARAANPLRVFPGPAHVAQTGVFGGPWLTSDEAMEKFPLFERPLREFFSAFARDVRRQDTTGGFDFGDAGSPGGWKNNETSLIEALFMQYLRSGDPALFRRAAVMARQFRDVAILHASQNSKWIQTHAAGLHTTGHWHVGHYWITGLIGHYLLTGDRRSFEAARGTAAELLSRHKLRYTGRERARVLLHLAELYELTHYKILRTAFETHLSHDVPMETGTYYAGINIMALEKWRSVTGGSPALDTRIGAYGHQLLDVVAKGNLLETVGEDRSQFIFEAAAALAARTGDPAYLHAFADLLPVQAMGAHSMGANAVRGAAWLWQADRLGVPLSPLTPAHPAGIALLTGRAGGRHDAALTFRIHPGAGASSPTVVRLYKQIGFRVGKNASDDVLDYRLTSGNPPSVELAAGSLAGPKFGILDLPPFASDVRLILHCGGDAQAELSVTHADVSLAAHDWLFFRQHRHGNGFVRFDIMPATPASDIVIALDWRFVDPGSIAAVELLDPQGRVIAHARRGRPLGNDWDDTGAPFEDPQHLVLRLPPGADTGVPLRMEMQAAKWLGWRVEAGLKEPWLAVPESQPAQP
ncbi:hypothetical protein OpiT1DRAFT_04447 [Opitutaceae bacterium TAV1]|nr:hypothetical protein OpiT1DRAFT_04447 [Opitutaceae bacterium TAV1]